MYSVGFGGQVEKGNGGDAAERAVWRPEEMVNAVAFDTPIPGWRGAHVNTLRLWSARAADPLSLDDFNRGDHVGALAERVRLEAISRVLYPSDQTAAGADLRLRQEYFFASASLQDLVRRHRSQHGELSTLPDYTAIQLNDTHPAIAVPELMRLLVDDHGMPWDLAWSVVTKVFNYTNHTLLPEALETWPVAQLERMLPRHLQIIERINAQHLDALRASGHDDGNLMASVSLIDEGPERRVKMGHLAFLGAHRVNGVSALHTDLMRQTVFRDLHTLHPERIVNKTNGITFRRWLFQANPRLTAAIVEAIGPQVLDDPEALSALAPLAGDAALARALHRDPPREQGDARAARRRADGRGPRRRRAVRRAHQAHARVQAAAAQRHGDDRAVPGDARRPEPDWAPRVKIFAGKAAAGYHRAKLIIKLIHDVAKTINADPIVQGLLSVVFLPNYNVSLAEAIIPASDLSEQISTAGMEASGTGNMKLALNGALTIGTLDGANIEIRERVGEANFFLFGLTALEVARTRSAGWHAEGAIARSPALGRVIDAIAHGAFSPDDQHRFRELVDGLRRDDYFMVTADFDAYYAAQRAVDARWRDPESWWRAATPTRRTSATSRRIAPSASTRATSGA